MSKFLLRFLWFGQKGIAVALDQVCVERSIPITEYFFWPRSDAWDDMRICLKSKTWISPTDLVSILNQLTEIINFWQEKNNSGIDSFKDLKLRFPEADFVFCN
uniref:30S ribosomal protein 3, chloroplastic n=1 Tax=Lepocinclis spirogyroides TaxID=298306 RepID=Q0R3L0_9EUGL|nr:Ycf65 [Lepocinclis spirogyroides]